ncbi:MAG: hypothetical protein UW72_C0009G0014 [Parcubacteria group bacterium GW2011_GWF2_44_7]|nr:MAG: hypothetical protein UW72_C0009G0014 [Parcubacteria group bacterium GW2011_GWF2_44_7]
MAEKSVEQKPKQDKPILMPGPQFGKEFNDNDKNWFSQNSQKIVFGIIIVLLVIGGYYIYKSYRNRQELLKPALQEMALSTSPSPQSSADNQNANANLKAAEESTPLIVTEATSNNENVVAKASRGNGTTHLARAALKEYLKDKDELRNKLLPEHKIYIEDYLRKHVETPKTLHPGDEITFSNQLIDEAIAKAQTLNENQINNLHKYVLLVPSL